MLGGNQKNLNTAVHDDTLTGPLRDAYGTAVVWFCMVFAFFEKTFACVVRTEQLFPAIHAMFLNYDFELPPRCVRCVSWVLDVISVVPIVCRGSVVSFVCVVCAMCP